MHFAIWIIFLFITKTKQTHFLLFFTTQNYTYANKHTIHTKPIISINSAASSPAKPRTTSKYDPANGNQTVGPSSGGGIMQRRSTRLLEKTLSSEKTSALPAEQK